MDWILQDGLTVINPAGAQMLGYKSQELLGRKIHQIVQHTRADGAPYLEADSEMMKSIDRMDALRVSNEIFWRKDGTSFPVDYVARPQIEIVEGRMGKAIGVVVAFTDTTERRALDRMKDEFISTVSHELRTPLTSLRAALGLITGGALNSRPEKMKKMLEIAIGNTDRLVRLVNDILDIERISSGNAELHSMMCSADELLNRATELQHAAALKTHLSFKIAGNGVHVWGDPDRILQALANLISNAIKFSPQNGEITLTARRLDDSEAQFDIHDQGRGIPEDRTGEHLRAISADRRIRHPSYAAERAWDWRSAGASSINMADEFGQVARQGKGPHSVLRCPSSQAGICVKGLLVVFAECGYDSEVFEGGSVAGDGAGGGEFAEKAAHDLAGTSLRQGLGKAEIVRTR